MHTENSLQFKQLSHKDLDRIVEIENSLENDAEIVIKSIGSDIAKCLIYGVCHGAFVNGELVSYTLSFPDKYKCCYIIEKCATHYKHRGHFLNRSTLGMVLEDIKKEGGVMAVATVSPKNTKSLKAFESFGFSSFKILDSILGYPVKRHLMVCRLQ